MQKQAVLTIYGKVQGVFFRESTRRRVKELNLTGWVRNEPDGTVRIVAEGEEKNLTDLIDWCKNSPDRVKVDHADAKWLAATNQFSDFLIK